MFVPIATNTTIDRTRRAFCQQERFLLDFKGNDEVKKKEDAACDHVSQGTYDENTVSNCVLSLIIDSLVRKLQEKKTELKEIYVYRLRSLIC